MNAKHGGHQQASGFTPKDEGDPIVDPPPVDPPPVDPPPVDPPPVDPPPVDPPPNDQESQLSAALTAFFDARHERAVKGQTAQSTADAAAQAEQDRQAAAGDLATATQAMRAKANELIALIQALLNS